MANEQNVAIAAKMQLAKLAEAKERAEEKAEADRKTARARRIRKISRRDRNARISKTIFRTIGKTIKLSYFVAGEIGGAIAVLAYRRLRKTKRGRALIAYGPRHAIAILITGRPIGDYDRPVTPPPLPKRRPATKPADAVRRACVRVTTVRKPSPGYSRITVLSANNII